MFLKEVFYAQQSCIYFMKNMVKKNILIIEKQISILKWFLKDCVILKTGVLAAENSAHYNVKYIKTENGYFKL